MSKWIEDAIREIEPLIGRPFKKWIEGKNGDTTIPKVFSKIAKALYEANKEEIEAALPSYFYPKARPALKAWEVFTDRALEVYMDMVDTYSVPDLSDSDFLAFVVEQAETWGNGAVYLLFNPHFSAGSLEWSDGHEDERVPKAARQRIAEIFAKTPPELLQAFPEKSDTQVWKVGDTYLQFSACNTSSGFDQAFIEGVTLVEPYEQTVTLYREVGKR